MFTTPPPPRKVLTRREYQSLTAGSGVKRGQHMTSRSTGTMDCPGTSANNPPGHLDDKNCDGTKEKSSHHSIKSSPPCLSLKPTEVKPVVKSTPPSRPPSISSARSAKSSASSIARRKQLEIELAEAKAMIQRLEVKLAATPAEEGCDTVSDCRSEHNKPEPEQKTHSHVEDWLENSIQHQNAHGTNTLMPPASAPAHEPPAQAIGTLEASIQQLAHTLKDMAHQSASEREDRLLTRLSTPRELPVFAGDCIDWLHFKSAYEESSQICKYSDSENMGRLRRALRGEAREAVADLLIGNAPPATVLEALELRFGRSDFIIHTLTSRLRKLPPLPTYYQNEIINFSMKVNNYVATIRALNQSDYIRSPELAASVIAKLPSTLLSKWTDYAYQQTLDGTPKLELLASFLKRESQLLSVVGTYIPQENKKNPYEVTGKRSTDSYNHKQNFNRHVFNTCTAIDTAKCKFCSKGNHELIECRLFKRALRKDKWNFVKSHKLCYCCLLSRHERGGSCLASACDIDNCGRAHHRLLHWSRPQPPAPRDTASTTVAHVATSDEERPTDDDDITTARRSSDVILKVVKVILRGPNGTIQTHALLDDAASVSIIDAKLADSIGLASLQASAIKFVDAFGIEVYHSDAPTVNAEICDANKNIFYDFKCRKVLNFNLPVQNLSIISNLKCKHLGSIKSKVCSERVVPRLLLGQDNYFLIAPLEVVHGGKNAPYASRCRLGWSIHGCCGRTLSHTHVSNANIFHLAQSHDEYSAQIHELNNLVKNSFELDCLGISTLSRENTDHLRAIQSLEDTTRFVGNQWEVGLPFKNNDFTMPDSYCNALVRHEILQKKFSRDPSYAERYTFEINKLFKQGYARELNKHELSADRMWYLPHFGVQNPNKPGKLRLVYDAAATVQGKCLNDYLLTGPDLYNSLLGIMLRFREHEVAFVGDIRDMFLRIKVRAEDQNLLRFLWQETADSQLKTCAMTSLIFGATCSPFIAQYIKNKNALMYEDSYSEATNVIINNHYMDDCLYSTTNTENATKLIKEITEIHKKGGFEIRGWTSNKRSVVNNISNDALAPTAVRFKHGATNASERTLGLIWYIDQDTFGFKFSLQRIAPEILNGTQAPTKSQMLSIIMSVYDPHGFLTPFTIKSKILFQNVHRSGVDWNCRIHSNELNAWTRWLEELKQIESLHIPRCYINAGAWTPCYADPGSIPDAVPNLINYEGAVDIQLHAFCDASIKAFAAAIYWRFTRPDGTVLVSFAASKSRVTPLRPVSIPRLELQGALIAARLANCLQNEHKDIKPVKRYFWTDSSTVLQWIRSDPRSYKPYVAHRLGEIDELTSVPEWRYVPSKLNVADIATKTDSPPMQYDDIWFQGPSYLREPEESWPRDLKNIITNDEVTCELRSLNFTTIKSIEWSLPDENNFSSWLRLLRSTAMLLFAVKKFQRRNVTFDINLMKDAEILLLKKCQSDTFLEEFNYIKENKQLNRKSKLLTLTPYLDEKGLLRVGGRIDKAAADLPASRPVILDGRHKIAQLLVEYYHRRALHGANELVVNELRQQYWVIKLRPTVRAVAARCLFCRYRRAAPQPQRMADLPAVRLQHNRRPFFATGLDYFGPMAVTIGRRRGKMYGLIFTCLTIRAIHIELTDDLTTDETIMALRRFIARRGTPHVLVSDNGTNLRGADAELKRSLAELNHDRLHEDGAVRGIEWRFIPPGAPEMGGAWERMIRTVKTALKVCLNERAPHPQTLATLMAEVEGLVNSRPITHVSNDPSYPEALTPNHFLMGTSSTGPVIGKFEQFDLNLRKQWRISQRLTDAFWRRWVKEYLPTLLPRQKWTTDKQGLQVGDYVIIIEPNLERGMWRHGVVRAVHPGDDGRVRVVDIKTRTGYLRRPVTRVALLASTDDSADSALWGENCRRRKS